MEHNLQDVLHAVWQPWAITDAPLNEQPLWNQMIDVASGLARIHNQDRGNDSIIGFHFDLKPSNILVTNQGLLKITDFGQALIKSVQENDQTYGIHRGGSPIYQAPEACASRPSMGSGDVDDKIGRKYDVWSLACIMLEVIIFILDRGPEGVKEFEKRSRNEEVAGAFYSTIPVAQLKLCVKGMLCQYERDASNAETGCHYLSNVVELLKQMFNIDHKNRPSSQTVHDRLSNIIEVQVVDKSQVSNVPGEYELGWRGDSGLLHSFLDM